MKKKILFAIFGLLTTVLPAQKVGFFNSDDIIEEIPAVQEASANLEELKTQLQGKVLEMAKEFQAKIMELEKQQAEGAISPKQLETKQNELRAEQASLQQYEQDVQKQLTTKQTELFKPIMDRISAIIKEVAAEQGFNYIFDGSLGIILYADPSTDVSDIIRQKLKA